MVAPAGDDDRWLHILLGSCKQDTALTMVLK